MLLAGESAVHVAPARKNFISVGANTAAVIPLSIRGQVAWDAAIAVLIGGLAGGAIGGKAMAHLPQRPLKLLIAGCGVVLVVRYMLFS